MSKSITIAFPTVADTTPVEVTYKIEMNEDIQTIICEVHPGNNTVLKWLSMRKFLLKSHYEDGAYTALYVENDSIKNVDGSLFLDKVYTGIMEKEKMTLAKV